MDSSATIRMAGFVLTGEKADSGGPSVKQVTEENLISDELLMAQVCQGSREALSILFRRYARLVHSVASRILRDRSEADDLLQEVFLLVHRKAEVFDCSKSSARSWMVQLTYHRAIDRRRHLQSRHFYTQVDLNDEIDVLDPKSELGEGNGFAYELVGNTTMQGLFSTLSDDQRDTLSLYFYEGYTFEEIAGKLNQSLGNIRNHYYRGLDKLRKKIFAAKLPGRNGCGKK